jgi:CxxC-x17-CxxC domain-containing protein
MEFQDKALRCVDCGTEFIWTAGEQLFFADKQFRNEPKRCKGCKAKRATRASVNTMGSATARDRVETQTTCSACGKDTTVPFRPTQGRPVFCKECFQQRKFAGAGGV